MKACSRNRILNGALRVLAFIAFPSFVFAFACGCSKKEEQVNPAVVESNQAKTEPVGPTTPKSDSPPQAGQLPPVVQPNGEPDLAEMNRYLLRWVMRNQRRPNNFEDFAATAGVAIPPPPAGKKYVIGRDMHIQLVNK